MERTADRLKLLEGLEGLKWGEETMQDPIAIHVRNLTIDEVKKLIAQSL